MIFAAGLSPAWQQILEFDAFQIGEVNRARTAHWCASGKVINVALAAHALKSPSSLLSTIGGSTGESIAAELAKTDIHCDWIATDQPTRVCTTILDATRITTELVEETPPVSQQVLTEFVDRFRIHAQVADVTVLTGSIPGNAPDDYYAQLIRNVPARMILDIRGPGLLQCLPFSPFMVKPNREELEQTFETKLDDEASIINAMQQVNKMGAQWVVVSDGPNALYATSYDQAFKFIPPSIDVVNPIGCGDCLAAGIAVGISEGQTVPEAIRLGVAAAAYNAQQLLPAKLNHDELDSALDTVSMNRIDSDR